MRRADPAVVAAACLLPVAALTQQSAEGGPVHPDDARRLGEYHAAAGKGLLDAFSDGDPGDLAVLAEVLRGDPLPPDQALAVMHGDWSCRMIKIGRLLPIAIYQPFRCRIGSNGSLEKLV